jgi:hypothetical protein
MADRNSANTLSQESLFVEIKRARWWDRLGGKPVGHAASPRFI